MAVDRPIHVVLAGKKEDTSLTFEDTTRVLRWFLAPKSPVVDVSYRNVVASTFREDHHHLEISYVSRKAKNSPYVINKLQGQVKESDRDVAGEWSRALTERAYEGARRNPRLKVLVNPKSGVGKAVKTFTAVIEPILRTAGCLLDVVHTTRSGHAHEIASQIPLDTYDAVVIVSGDGLIHEVFNGFADHSKPRKAFAIPLAPIPAGSGNALSLNLLGLKDGFDCVAATMNILKGKRMNVDLFSFTQNGKRTISFMTQSIGMVANIDVGTDHLRWMGDARFTYGFLRELVKMKPCPVELSYKADTLDKKMMVEGLKERRDYPGKAKPPLQPTEDKDDRLPSLKYSNHDADGWTVHKKPLMDYMAFPVSLPDDGVIDIVARGVSARGNLLSSTLDGWANGQEFWNENVTYIKARAFRIKPLPADTQTRLAIDGEEFPLEEFQVEVIPRLGTLLSPQDHYAIEFKV
ncbi:sphinganine kinase lcb4 [Marasmius tenuissimus]|uniref:Sphinganine kinase lcb4 n=1 Tax=Marasmius tenuissimus TaxID=585030 RepID=A0ABR2ZAD4_9AGAR